MVTYTQPRYGAMALSGFFAGVTGYVLFNDVLHGSPITTQHILSLAALVAAIASGHQALPELKRGHILTAAALGLLFLASTAYIVVSSGARNAETAEAKTQAAKDVTARRTDVQHMKADAVYMLADCPAGTPAKHIGNTCSLKAAMVAECKSGKGKRCDGLAYSVQTYEAAIAGYDAKLAEIGPEKPANGYAHAARLIATLPWISSTSDAIASMLELWIPFATVLISEIGTIVFGHIFMSSLGHGRSLPNKVAANDQAGRPSAEELAAFKASFEQELPDPTPPKPRKKTKPDERRADVSDFVGAYRARHGRDPEQHEVRAALGLPRSTTSRYYNELLAG